MPSTRAWASRLRRKKQRDFTRSLNSLPRSEEHLVHFYAYSAVSMHTDIWNSEGWFWNDEGHQLRKANPGRRKVESGCSCNFHIRQKDHRCEIGSIAEDLQRSATSFQRGDRRYPEFGDWTNVKSLGLLRLYFIITWVNYIFLLSHILI